MTPLGKRVAKALVAVAVGFVIHGDFASEGAIQQREVTGDKNHAEDPPDQRNLQARPALTLFTVSEYRGFRAGSTMG